MRFISLITALVSLAGAAIAADAVQRRSNAEYGFTVAFPAIARPGVAGSWRHAHGWGNSLGGESEVELGITVQGDYNSADAATPSEATCCSDPYLAAGAKLHLGFSDRKSATCREDHAEGYILITV